MKKSIAFLLALYCIITINGCAKNEPEHVPEAIAAGFYSEGTVQTGGTAAQDAGDMNAKSLSIYAGGAGDRAETVLSFTFVTGSRMSGGEQETAGCGVPQYSVFAYDYPARLVVQFENLAFWDYRHGFAPDHDLVRGTFQQSIFESPKIAIYFQLDRPVYFLAETSADTLSVRLWPKEADTQRVNHYVTANAYDLYRTGGVSMEINAAPTLAADMQNILLISPPMETEEEAAAYLANAKRQYPSIPAALWNICALTGQALPEYNSSLDYFAVFQTPAVRLEDGALRTLPVLAPDGLYLCDLPGGERFLYSKELPAEEDGTAYQQLMAIQPGRPATQLLSFDFAAIERVQFSPDGRRLALLERSGGGSHLYIFDANTYELINDLSEMGFGNNTSAFIWNSLGNTVYAITGESTIQLHQFDYSIPDETKRHTMVDRNSVDEGSLGFCDGELYFTVASLEEGSMIYRIKPEGGVRKPFIPGSRFIISSDANYLAFFNTSEGGQNASAYNGLSIYEFATGQTRTVTNAFYPYDCIWSRDCSKLYYIESHVSGGQTEEDTATEVAEETEAAPADTPSVPEDPFPFTLWVYDVQSGQSTRLLDICAPDLHAAAQQDVLYLNRFEMEADGTTMRTTYILDLNRVFLPPEENGADTENAAEETGDTLKLD